MSSLLSVSQLCAPAYQALGGERHRHGSVEHAHPHEGAHTHSPHEHGHNHSHGLIDDSIKRSRAGIRAVSLSLGVLGFAVVA